MIEIALSKKGKHKGYFAIVDDQDFDLSALNWSVVISAKNKTKYARRREQIKGKKQEMHMHRIILERKIGRALEDNELPDHIDGNGLNNVRENLRVATLSQNAANRSMFSNSKTHMKGISRKNSKWQAKLQFEKQSVYIGVFDTPEEAHEAYCMKAEELFGEFWRAA